MQTCFGWTSLFLFRLLLVTELALGALDLIHCSAAHKCILSTAGSIRFLVSGCFQGLAVFRIAFWYNFSVAGLSVSTAVCVTAAVALSSAIILLNVGLGNRSNNFSGYEDELAPACGILQAWWGAWHGVKIIWVGTAMLGTALDFRKRRLDGNDNTIGSEPIV